MKRTLYVLTLVLATGLVFAQEGLKPLSANLSYVYPDLAHPNGELRSEPALRTQTTSLFIPFIEDFYYAYKSHYPDKNKWSDSTAYINAGYPVKPPTIGVATFDGLNKFGYPYTPNLINNTLSKPADTLTSRPINLLLTATSQTLQPSDSVALSFYYQSAGFGDAPEVTDSLNLDFFAPLLNQWINVWYKTRSSNANTAKGDTTFTRAFIWIDSTKFLKDNFRFRFRNSATTTGNFDHWHVDYVYLNKNRSMLADTLYDDLTFGYMPGPLLRDYSAMPFEQYTGSEIAPKIDVKIRNNSSGALNMTYEYRIDSGSTQLSTYNGNAFILPPYRSVGYSSFAAHAAPPVNFTFAPMSDSADYKVTHIFYQSGSASDFVANNDTVVMHQYFKNYYSLDDGSAEAGYYVNAAAGKIAIKINVNVADSFLGARIYFDPVGQLNQAQNSLGFRIKVWAAGASGPGMQLFQDTIFKPKYYNTAPGYGFPEYKLIRPLMLSPGSYYIGIQQLADVMTIGFDRNIDHRTTTYYDSGSGWIQSGIGGSVMIRPVFGRTLPHPVGISENDEALKNSIRIYPNPAADLLTLRAELSEPLNYRIFNTVGQLLLEGTMSQGEEQVNTSSLAPGLYLLTLKTGTRVLKQQKIIIQR